MFEFAKSIAYNEQSPEVFLAPSRLLTKTIGEYRMADYQNNSIYYVPQVPCRRGHFLRYSKNGLCVRCQSISKTGKDNWKPAAVAYFRSDYNSNPSQFNPPFDNCVCIPLTKSAHALIDSEDFDAVSLYRWHLADHSNSGLFYATYTDCTNNKFVTIGMHRLVNKTASNLVTDHINGNGLDNRKSNLRSCTETQNKQNRKSSKSSTSKYIGVYRAGRKGTNWIASISINKKNIYLGFFKSELEAAKAYDQYAFKHRGEFARLNFPHLVKEPV